MALSSEQRRILGLIKAIGQQVGATPKEVKAAIETGIVESNLSNPSGGMDDSAGWRQERASIYKDPTNLSSSIHRFFNETRQVRDKYGTAGALAAAVQRPAAQYRGRYQQHSAEAQGLLGGVAPSASHAAGPTTRTITTPGVDNSDARRQALSAFLLGGTDPTTGQQTSGDILSLALQMRQLKDTPGTTTTSTAGRATARAPGGASGGGGAHAALSWAESKLGNPGARETGGENRGQLADFLNQRFGFGSTGAQPWCAMFTSAAVTKGGAPASARTASVAQVRQKAMQGVGYQRGYVPGQQAKPGDLILFGNDHIGMVKSNHNGHITYVGGNQSDAVTEGQVPAHGASIVRPKYGARR
jgi:hypothetical protein